MGKVAGGALRLISTFLYFLEFLCSAVGLAVFSYFLAKLSYHHLPIAQRWRAVEGITGAGVLYTIFAILLTCFLGGKPFFAIIAVLLNLCFCGAFVAVAVLTRHGAASCSGVVNTPLGIGPTNVDRAGTNQGTACRLNTAVFAVAIIGAFLFLVSLLLQIFLMRNHQSEKKYGPSPANNFTSGSGGSRFWRRKPRTVATTKDVYENGNGELGTVGATGGLAATNGRPSRETEYTGTTAAEHGAYNNATVNPYGYNNTPQTGTAVNY